MAHLSVRYNFILDQVRVLLRIEFKGKNHPLKLPGQNGKKAQNLKH